MASISATIESLRYQISACEVQLRDLQQQLAAAQSYQTHSLTTFEHLTHDMEHGLHDDYRAEILSILAGNEEPKPIPKSWPLENFEYRRYGRQLILPEIGLQGQLRLKSSSVLIIGVGGLGCPAAVYLAGAGVGTLGLVDGDIVDESNLHRQILHNTPKIGRSKVDSAIGSLSSLNPGVKFVPNYSRLTPQTAIETVQQFDLVLDCTDTPASRYLISDACVLLGKPLVSASALRTEGQLMVLNNPPRAPGDAQGGPCYRCVFPKPPPAESVISCGEGGILGPVVGVMGVLQALEAIKIIARGIESNPTARMDLDQPARTNSTPSSGASAADPPSLLLFSAYSNPMFRSIRLRSRKPKCAACSSHATVTRQALTSGSMDYVQFCGVLNPVDALSPSERISAENYAKIRKDANPFTGTEPSNDSHVLVDVREKVQFDLCNIEGSVNIPFSVISSTRSDADNATEDWVAQLRTVPEKKPIFVVCRLGNDSQLAVNKMKELGFNAAGQRWIGDIKGGLRAWRDSVDHDFPEY